MMAKPGMIFFCAVACLFAPCTWSQAAETECSQELAPMAEALHAVVNKAERTAKTGDVARAARILTDYLETHTQETHPYPYYDAGYFLHQAGKSDAAIDYLQKAVTLNPCFVEAWQFLASVHQETEQPQKAAAALEKAASMTQDSELWYQAAILWLNAERPKAALIALEKVSSEQQETSDWYVATARARQGLEENVKAAQAMASAYALSKDPEMLYQCAVFWMEAGKPGQALPLLQQLTEMDAPESHWLVALSNALKALEKKEDTARAMERAARRSRDPELWFHAGYLWLEADRAQKALVILKKLAKRKHPEVKWLLALANTHIILDQTRSAATVMDRIVQMDPKSEYLYNAGVLWLHAEQPEQALHHLRVLCKRSPAQAAWFVALAHAWLGHQKPVKAARAMERAAEITGKGKEYYQAGRLWLQAGNTSKGISLLEICASKKPAKQQWLVSLAQAFMDADRKKDASMVMARTRLTDSDVTSAVRYQGAVLWLQLRQPQEALSILEILCTVRRPGLDWLVSLVKTHVELAQPKKAEKGLERLIDCYPENPASWQLAVWLGLEQDDYARAAAAMAVAVRLGPPDPEQLEKLADLYHMAGVPVKAAATLQKTWKKQPMAGDWDRLVNIYLGGHRYHMALAAARSAVEAQASAERWKTVGAIAFRLRRFEESYDAYCHAAKLSRDADIRLRAGYAALKLNQWEEATRLFKAAVRQARKNSKIASEAHRNLAFIKKMRAGHEKGG
ncbi:MAG: tetratricopeptide repeat protein [Desulfatiglandaceae bacterium]